MPVQSQQLWWTRMDHGCPGAESLGSKPQVPISTWEEAALGEKAGQSQAAWAEGFQGNGASLDPLEAGQQCGYE